MFVVKSRLPADVQTNISRWIRKNGLKKKKGTLSDREHDLVVGVRWAGFVHISMVLWRMI